MPSRNKLFALSGRTVDKPLGNWRYKHTYNIYLLFTNLHTNKNLIYNLDLNTYAKPAAAAAAAPQIDQ